ncbi:hypothetical protein MASR2M15_05470 [Anaerolineales bacterium]
MTRSIQVAVTQMDASFDGLDKRLARAEKLVQAAAAQQAQIVVLPEFFNTGYHYDERNYLRSESMDGQTVGWMREMAQQYQVHLLGSLMLRDIDEVYNSALLFAPDGRFWRHDKLYPFAWERAYFREGNGITIADTELGKIGIMIGWDAAHADMWERYASRVDLMLICNNAVQLSSAAIQLPDGKKQHMGDINPAIYSEKEYFCGEDLDAFARWISVPVVQSMGSGEFRSQMPMAMASWLGMTSQQPLYWRYLDQAHSIEISAGYDKVAKIVSAEGQIIGQIETEGDGLAIASVTLADQIPLPQGSKPEIQTSKMVFFFADIYLPFFQTFVYRRGLRRYFGRRMAPIAFGTQVWSGAVMASLVIGLWLGRKSKF